MFDAIVFATYDAGFVARCALEVSGATTNRIDKVYRIISECRYGIHDISRTEPGAYGLPRFNMPLELGIFLGCMRFGRGEHPSERCLVLDRRPYRYQRFISDIAGQDVEAHDGRSARAIAVVRNWLRAESRRRNIPGGAEIGRRFRLFRRDMPEICRRLKIRVRELTFVDYTYVMRLDGCAPRPWTHRRGRKGGRRT